MTTRTQQITITKRPTHKGGSAIEWAVDLDGRPFGMIWTFKNTATETHRFHAKTLRGVYDNFATYDAAERFIRGCM